MISQIFTPKELFGEQLSASGSTHEDIDQAAQLLWDAQRLRVVPRSSPAEAAVWFLSIYQLPITIMRAWGDSEDPELRRIVQSDEGALVSRMHKVYCSTAALVTAPGSRTFESFADYRVIC